MVGDGIWGGGIGSGVGVCGKWRLENYVINYIINYIIPNY